MENDDLKKQVEEFFRLLKKVMEKYPPEKIPGIDKAQLEQLKEYMSRYEQFDGSLSIEIPGFVNKDIAKRAMEMMTQRLREQLGEEAYDEPEVSEIEVKEQAFESLQTAESCQALIDAIDAELKNKDLTMEEIDELLDKRQSILKKSK